MFNCSATRLFAPRFLRRLCAMLLLLFQGVLPVRVLHLVVATLVVVGLLALPFHLLGLGGRFLLRLFVPRFLRLSGLLLLLFSGVLSDRVLHLVKNRLSRSACLRLLSIRLDSAAASFAAEDHQWSRFDDDMCCLLVLDSVTFTPQWIHQPRPCVYLKEGTYHTRLFRGPSTNDMKK